MYGDRHGVPVSNSFRYFKPDGTSILGVSFAYWTDPLFDPTTTAPTDTKFNMLTAEGKNAPAPWVPFTRAGCNFGAVATANTILENIQTDIPTVFGAGSPQAQEVATNPGQAFADFVGIGVHCAAGDALCSAANGGEPDLLPDEPGAYNGFNGLFGHVYVAPSSVERPMTDLNGQSFRRDRHISFPFDGMAAKVSLRSGHTMSPSPTPTSMRTTITQWPRLWTRPAGPVAALAAYDDAFNKFFARLAADGITRDNTCSYHRRRRRPLCGGAPSPAVRRSERSLYLCADW